MIRPATMRRTTGPGYRRRLGQGGSAALGLSSLATAGIGAATSLVSTGISVWMNSIQLSHNADTATTLIVNGLAQQLSNLVQAYMNDPPSCATQRAALDAYDQAWLWLQSPQACGNPNYGSAGNRCISDRAPGGKFPWQTYYRDPIANDPRLGGAGCDTSQQVLLPSLATGTYEPSGILSSGTVESNAAAASPVTTVAAAPISTSVSPALLIGAALLLGVIAFK